MPAAGRRASHDGAGFPRDARSPGARRPPSPRTASKMAARGRPVDRAPSGADRRARLDRRHADSDRHLRGTLAGRPVRDGPVLDRAPPDDRRGARLPLRLEMDERRMTPLSLAGCFAAGLLLGALYFRSIWWSARRFAEGRSMTTVILLSLARLAMLGGLLALASLQGALPLLAMAAGIVAIRPLMMRRLHEAAR